MTSSGETSPLNITPAGTPLSNQAPKYGTLIPNRIFVGGIAANQTNEQELKQFFSAYGAVKDCKIIADRAGVSKGYGFVTFETQEDAEKIIKKEADNLIFKDRKLNIGPAIRKQQAFPKLYEQSMTPGAVFFSNGVPYTYQNGMAVFQPSAENYTALSTQQYPMMMQSTAAASSQQAAMYALSQQSAAAAAAAAGYPTAYTSPTAAATAGWGAQWRWTPQSPQTASTVANSQYMAAAGYPLQSTTLPHDMLYASAGTATQYAATEIPETSMLDAAGAEGSMVMDPNIIQQPPYADAMNAASLPQAENPSSEQPSQPQSSSSISYGKRHGAPLVITPRKHMNHPAPCVSSASSACPTLSLSPRATPPPAKVFQGHGPLTPPATPEVQHT